MYREIESACKDSGKECVCLEREREREMESVCREWERVFSNRERGCVCSDR